MGCLASEGFTLIARGGIAARIAALIAARIAACWRAMAGLIRRAWPVQCEASPLTTWGTDYKGLALLGGIFH